MPDRLVERYEPWMSVILNTSAQGAPRADLHSFFKLGKLTPPGKMALVRSLEYRQATLASHALPSIRPGIRGLPEQYIPLLLTLGWFLYRAKCAKLPLLNPREHGRLAPPTWRFLRILFSVPRICP